MGFNFKTLLTWVSIIKWVKMSESREREGWVGMVVGDVFCARGSQRSLSGGSTGTIRSWIYGKCSHLSALWLISSSWGGKAWRDNFGWFRHHVDFDRWLQKNPGICIGGRFLRLDWACRPGPTRRSFQARSGHN